MNVQRRIALGKEAFNKKNIQLNPPLIVKVSTWSGALYESES